MKNVKLTVLITALLGIFAFNSNAQDDPYQISKAQLEKYCGMSQEQFKAHLTENGFEFLIEDEPCESYWKFCLDCAYDVVFWTCPKESGYFSIIYTAEKTDPAELADLKALIAGFKEEMKEFYSEEREEMYDTPYFFEMDGMGYSIGLEESSECEEAEFSTVTDCYSAHITVYIAPVSDEMEIDMEEGVSEDAGE